MTTATTGTDPDQRVQSLLAEYDRPGACAAELLCDRHPADAVAFTLIQPDLSSTDVTYAELTERSSRVAGALVDMGIAPGDHVATLMGKSAELMVTLLAIWRCGAVHVPLFTAFAPPAIAFRLQASGAKLVVSDAYQLGKLEPGEDIPADPAWRVVEAGGAEFAGWLDHAPIARAVAIGGGGALVELFTSGTTGTPKGVPVPLRALASFQGYLEFGLDVRLDDVFWNAADPGWAYGLYYAILGPLASGVRTLLLHAGFSAALTWQVLDTFGVTNFAAAPTVYRSLRAATTAIPKGLRLRRASSAGEPLTPDVVGWSKDVFGVSVRDHYGQTEHGMFIVNAWAEQLGVDAPGGSMGKALPGWSCAVLADNADEIAPNGTVGRVAIDTHNSPMMWFTGYVDAPEKTAQRFTADRRWYLTGDAGKLDADGYYYFSARDDDVIIMAGYRIGPFDVESVLVMHGAVAEAAVVGKPDELRGEVIEAYVVLREHVAASDELVVELQQLVKRKFAAHAYPRRVHFVDALPKTPSGKIQRFLLRQR